MHQKILSKEKIYYSLINEKRIYRCHYRLSEFNIQNCKNSYNSKTNNPLKKWAKDLLKFTACEMTAQGQGSKSSYCTSFHIQKMLNHEYTLFSQTLYSVFNALFFKLSRILL